MSDLALPPLMGMFCTGYVLHLAWAWWHNRRVRQRMARVRLMLDLHESIFNVVWKDWDIEVPHPSSPSKGAM